jgi:hypothetical protein
MKGGIMNKKDIFVLLIVILFVSSISVMTIPIQ